MSERHQNDRLQEVNKREDNADNDWGSWEDVNVQQNGSSKLFLGKKIIYIYMKM